MLPPPVVLHVPDAAFLHEEHFPGAPCVPGSCLMEAVRKAALQSFGRPVICMAQARFRRFVPPGSVCRLIWKLPPSAGPSPDTEGLPGCRRVGWQLVAVLPEEDASGGRLAEGEVWLAPDSGEDICG